MALWAQWKCRIAGQRGRLELGYERQEWAQSRILGHSIYDVELRQNVTARSRFEFDLEYAPQIYLQHRLDKDAPPGAPWYRPQAFSELEMEFGYHWQQGTRLEPVVFATYSVRDEQAWFNERDRRRVGLGAAMGFPLGAVWLEPAYEFRGSRSRNVPNLGSDLSYNEQVADFRLRAEWVHLAGPWHLEARMRWKFRRYTTDDAEDERRYRRHDEIYYWMVKLRRAGVQVTPMLSLEASGRWVSVPDDEDTIDEAGEVDRTLLRLGVEWVVETED
jgi:hypothetical protein